MTSPRLILFRAWPENEYKNNSQRTCRNFRTVACKLPTKMIQYSCQRSAYLRICIKPFGITSTGRFYYLESSCFFLYSVGVRIPSICSNKSSLMVERIGSSMKSIPSRRACFAAGTKSLSPDIRII